MWPRTHVDSTPGSSVLRVYCGALTVLHSAILERKHAGLAVDGPALLGLLRLGLPHTERGREGEGVRGRAEVVVAVVRLTLAPVASRQPLRVRPEDRDAVLVSWPPLRPDISWLPCLSCNQG